MAKELTIEEMREKIREYCYERVCSECELLALDYKGECYSDDFEGFEKRLKRRCDKIDGVENTEEVREVEPLYNIQLTGSQLEDLADFIQFEFIDSIRNNEETDNIYYLCNICDVFRKLEEVRKG